MEPLSLRQNSEDLRSPLYGLVPELLMQVFPFHLVCDRQLRLRQVGASLHRLCPAIQPGCLLQEIFQIERPVIAFELDAILRQNCLFVIKYATTGLKLRGQMLYDASQSLLFFVGSPWITSFTELKGVGLELSDFAIVDPITDFLVLTQTQNTALQDVRRLAEKLTKQRTELKRALSLLQATLESTADGILVVNNAGIVETMNQKFVEMWQLPVELSVLKPEHHALLEWISQQLCNAADFLPKVLAISARPESISQDLVACQDGRMIERTSYPQWLNQEIVGRVWSFRDMTKRHQQEQTIRYQATHDSLTGLPNRLLFSDRLSVALAHAIRDRTKLAVMFLDLDRFKAINDTFGHAVGDRILQTVSRRLSHCLRESDTIARWAGDEFTLLLPNLHSASDATLIAQKLLEAVKPVMDLEKYRLRTSISIGIALYPDDGSTVETLLQHADAALYRAKAKGRDLYHFYTRAIDAENPEKLHLENDLHQALENQEFTLYYQPRINVKVGTITNVEALIRWQHPELGLIPPSKFIPLAEETGLIVPLGEWVLRTACTQNRLWQGMGLPPVKMAVNLSARQFKQPGLVELAQGILQATHLAPTTLEFEITETVLMENQAIAQTTLSQLRDLGVSISMDDFGTGYSSLSYLKEFPFQTLKIDRSFVQDINTDPNNKAIVNAIIAMGKAMNLNLVAEGVETEMQRDLLQSLGCEEMQGFYFSPPVPADQVTRLLRQRWVPQQSD